MAECNDPKCPVHGHLKVRGRGFTGKVMSAKMQRSITLEIERKFLIKKYHRYEKRYTKITAHNPPCIDAKEGDIVEVKECRPLSKTKAFVVIKKFEEINK